MRGLIKCGIFTVMALMIMDAQAVKGKRTVIERLTALFLKGKTVQASQRQTSQSIVTQPMLDSSVDHEDLDTGTQPLLNKSNLKSGKKNSLKNK